MLRGAELIGATRDATFPMPDGPWPASGAVLAAVEAADRPHAPTASSASPSRRCTRPRATGSAPGRVLAVGDRLEIDVAGARRAGLDSALVLTGGTTRERGRGGRAAPDARRRLARARSCWRSSARALASPARNGPTRLPDRQPARRRAAAPRGCCPASRRRCARTGCAFRVERTTSIEHARELARDAARRRRDRRRDGRRRADRRGRRRAARQRRRAGACCPAGAATTSRASSASPHDPVAAVRHAGGGQRAADRRRRGRRQRLSSGSSARASTPTSTRSPTRRGCRSARSSTPTARCARCASWQPRALGRRPSTATEHTFAGYSVAVANSGVFGGGMWLVPDAALDDGLLDVVLTARPPQAARTCAACTRSSRARTCTSPASRSCAAARSRFRADRPFTAYADGDPIAELPVDRARAARRAAGDRAVMRLAGGAARRARRPAPSRGRRARRRHVAARQGADARRAARDRAARRPGSRGQRRHLAPPTARRRPPRWSRRSSSAPARGSCTTAPGANMAGGVAARWPRGARGGGRDGDLGLFEVDEFWLGPVVERARAARGAARQPVPRPARPLRRAGDDRRPLGRRSSPACRPRPARAQRRRPAGRRPRPRPRRRSTSASRTTRSRCPSSSTRRTPSTAAAAGTPTPTRPSTSPTSAATQCPNCGQRRPDPPWWRHRRRAARHPLAPRSRSPRRPASGGSSCRCPASTTSTTRSAPPRCACSSASPLDDDRRRAWPRSRPRSAAPRRSSSAAGRRRSCSSRTPRARTRCCARSRSRARKLDLFGVLNDRTADGRDVSWVWDADWELLAPHVRRLTCSGTRAAELALRLKYAGVDAGAAEGRRRPRARASTPRWPTAAARCTRCPPTPRCSSCKRAARPPRPGARRTGDERASSGTTSSAARYTADLPLWGELAARGARAGARRRRRHRPRRAAPGARRATRSPRSTSTPSCSPSWSGARARRRACDVETVVADAARLRPRRGFGLVAVPMQTIQLLPDAPRGASSPARGARSRPAGCVALAIADRAGGVRRRRRAAVARRRRARRPDAFVSQPTAVRAVPGATRIERLRHTIAPDGRAAPQHDVIELARRQRRRAGGRGRRRRAAARARATIEPTPEHVGSEVVLLRG